jgi:hypothetical protein
VVIAAITSNQTFQRIRSFIPHLETQLKTVQPGAVEILYFSSHSVTALGVQIIGLQEHCESDSHEGGLCCKTHFSNNILLERYPSALWYMHILDDTFVHLENLIELLRTISANHPVMLGEVFHTGSGTFITGGPGLILSRPAMLLSVAPPHKLLEQEECADDVLWSQMLVERDVTLISQEGMRDEVVAFSGCTSSPCPPGARPYSMGAFDFHNFHFEFHSKVVSLHQLVPEFDFPVMLSAFNVHARDLNLPMSRCFFPPDPPPKDWKDITLLPCSAIEELKKIHREHRIRSKKMK